MKFFPAIYIVYTKDYHLLWLLVAMLVDIV